MRPFRRDDEGRILANFAPLEAELIGDLAGQIADLLDENVTLPADRLLSSIGIGGGDSLPEDPAVARLLPDAYADDAEASRDFRRLTETSLATRKIENARLVSFSLRAHPGEEFELGAEAQGAWLRTINDIRLVIASRLGIETDDDEGLHDTDEQLMLREVYDWLALVQDTLIAVLDA